MITTTYASYAAYALTLPNGGLVQEFLNNQGEVFAIAWRGPSRPDLRQLLGTRFSTLQTDNALNADRRLRRRAPLHVGRSDFVLHGGGHSGAFHGVAYLPGAVPAGFSASDIQ